MESVHPVGWNDEDLHKADEEVYLNLESCQVRMTSFSDAAMCVTCQGEGLKNLDIYSSVMKNRGVVSSRES